MKIMKKKLFYGMIAFLAGRIYSVPLLYGSLYSGLAQQFSGCLCAAGAGAVLSGMFHSEKYVPLRLIAGFGAFLLLLELPETCHGAIISLLLGALLTGGAGFSFSFPLFFAAGLWSGLLIGLFPIIALTGPLGIYAYWQELKYVKIRIAAFLLLVTVLLIGTNTPAVWKKPHHPSETPPRPGLFPSLFMTEAKEKNVLLICRDPYSAVLRQLKSLPCAEHITCLYYDFRPEKDHRPAQDEWYGSPQRFRKEAAKKNFSLIFAESLPPAFRTYPCGVSPYVRELTEFASTQTVLVLPSGVNCDLPHCACIPGEEGKYAAWARFPLENRLTVLDQRLSEWQKNAYAPTFFDGMFHILYEPVKAHIPEISRKLPDRKWGILIFSAAAVLYVVLFRILCGRHGNEPEHLAIFENSASAILLLLTAWTLLPLRGITVWSVFLLFFLLRQMPFRRTAVIFSLLCIAAAACKKPGGEILLMLALGLNSLCAGPAFCRRRNRIQTGPKPENPAFPVLMLIFGGFGAMAIFFGADLCARYFGTDLLLPVLAAAFCLRLPELE